MKTFLKKVGLLIMTASLLTSCKQKNFFELDDDQKFAVQIWNKNYEGIKELIDKGVNVDRVKLDPFIYKGSCRYAFYKSDDEVLKFLIENGADVNYKFLSGISLLMDFANSNRLVMCKFALEHGANINDKDYFGNTALEYVFTAETLKGSEQEKERMMSLFVDNGAKVRAKTLEAAFKGAHDKGDGDGKYQLVKKVLEKLIDEGVKYEIDPVLEAAMLGHEEKMITLIKDGKMLPEYENQILFYTAGFGSVDSMKFLKEAGVDLFAVDNYNKTTLMVASRYGNLEMVKYLAEEKLDVEAKDYEGKTAIIEAAEYNQVNVIKELIKVKAKTFYEFNEFPNSALESACRYGSLDVVQFFIENPQLTDEYSISNAIDNAVLCEQIDIARYLIDMGIDMNFSSNGDDIFSFACRKGNLELVKLLAENGALINGLDNEGEPLIASCESPNLEIVKYLVENGAYVNAVGTNSEGLKTESALMTAIKYGCFDTIKYLVENGADINYVHESMDGYGVISYAAPRYSTNILKYIIENGSDINYQNYNGETPLMLAVQSGNYDNVKVLLENNADTRLENNDEKTALDIAEENDFNDIVKLLEKKN